MEEFVVVDSPSLPPGSRVCTDVRTSLLIRILTTLIANSQNKITVV